jgi:choline dehydrogenase-like flavoprotein
MSPNYGITDSFGALHLYHNIGVASGAILPTTSWFNPTLLIMSMARLTCSRIIKSTFNPTRGL